ncbi:zinc-binding dehydrogenase [Pyrenophora seminiperda CCB06]|uniref:Zinc-binding dehydrogenase n=1 Tax=Pyrenophora seminiperda CCB06 TaxID=1302712 RepID=A0A3M7LZ98_9PLEO|nr:zinc-binding dehydrogenase [Pyrenophora seminiperda CCB06]
MVRVVEGKKASKQSETSFLTWDPIIFIFQIVPQITRPQQSLYSLYQNHLLLNLKMSTCRAWRVPVPGNVTTNLELVSIPRPSADHLDKHAVLVQVVSASIYKGDWWPIELGGVSKIMGSYPRSPGYDFGGYVVAVGRKVTGVKPGDPVFGRMDPFKQGSLAEYIIAPFEGLAVLPPSVSPRLAGTAGTSALAAYQAIAPFVEPGDKVLINGGSGGVGTFGIQIARALGCSVTVTCSTDKVQLCKELGAEDVIDYKNEHVMTALRQRGKVFAHIVDAIGGSPPDLYSHCDDFVLPGKRRHFAQVGGGITGASYVNTVVGVNVPHFMGGARTKMKNIIVTNTHEDMKQIALWMGEGKVQPVIDSTFSFEQVPDAFTRHKKGGMAGKVLIDVATYKE